MGGTASDARVQQAARVVDRFAERFDFACLSASERRRALTELSTIRQTTAVAHPDFAAALERLGTRMANAPKRRRKTQDSQSRRFTQILRWLAPIALLGASVPATASALPLLFAASLIGTITVGDQVYNPVTGQNETVVQVIGSPGYSVVTSQDHVILLAQEVGDSYTVVNPDTNVGTTYTVTAVTKDSGGHVTSVTLKDGANNTSTANIVAAYTPPPSPGTDGSGSTNVTFPTASGDVNQYTDFRKGDNGGNGHDGYGVCFGALGCIKYSPTEGGSGAPGPSFTDTVDYSNWADITTVSNNLSGIIAVSAGGNGGTGGDAYGNFSGASGGGAGSGGNVTLNNHVNITTTGTNSHGILVQSQSGIGGSGGDGYIAGSGGGGGGAGQGGTAHGTNYGNISTSGYGSIGLFVQSLGGTAGTGGDSYGIVGDAGDGSIGGNGGTAIAENYGIIHTSGDFAHGVMAQSLGGNGGNSGSSGGLVAFGGSGGGAGNGGSATIYARAGSEVVTSGDFAHGLFAQSVGGGGGAAKASGGAVTFGGDGGSAGTGGTAQVIAEDGAYVETQGTGSYGIFVQSIGGSGGTAGGTGGIFTLGGSGGTGNNAGQAIVTSGATIITAGEDARGIFAQSVGGGGGNANASGGLVSLGGSGSAAGNGAAVSVTLSAASHIETTGKGADGVFAQSVGGGGGAGAASGGLFALGGSGGSGGSGGQVTVSNGGYISTEGDFARGIFAQSVGGGGGSGGDAGGLAAIGGSGSSTSSAGNVSASNSGTILTAGNFSSGLQAQSIGGGGGDGGSTGGVFLTIGGSGGGGGDSGTVTVSDSGSIATTGDDSHGIFAQAVGGGGGNGGSATSVSAFVGVAIGGNGSVGGDGGNTTVNFSPRTVQVDGVDTEVNPIITTSGDRSRGVYVQSVGGGGGSGGYSASIALGAWGAASIAIGGSGGGGGDGGTVNVNGDVTVVTSGDSSEGIFAQSVGGGGGAGGFSVSGAISGGLGFSGSLAIGIGGSGGDGGDGGQVNMDSGGVIVTSGAFSTGLLAQSVGGGGGAGGFNVSASVAGSDTAAVSVPIGIGGSGGSGGIGGTVDVSFDGDISTGGVDGSGHDSAGAIIQSIGGGGGTGGFNVSGAIAGSGVAAIGVAVGLGGSGGSGGDGGTVTGSIGGNIHTTGDRSTGALIQSVGGGGGSGGFNVSGTITGSGVVAGGISVGLGGSGAGGGDGGDVTGSVGGTILTEGDQSDALIVQSLGGGGGSGGFNVSGNIAVGGTVGGGISVGLGGSGGNGGSAGTVIATASDDIETDGNQSRGFVAQSIGGGGGSGAFNVSGDLAIGGTASGSIGVGLGGSGGTGGDSGNVTASAQSITTFGDQSAGFIAQSVGGGGGSGAFNVTGGLDFSGTASGAIGVGLGGTGGGGGDAGSANATIDGNVVTSGDESGAIFVQSLGGGGGSGGFNVSGSITAAGTGAASINVGLGGSGGGGGDSAAASLDLTGAAGTSGDGSDAVVVQSIGGGGGAGAFNVSAGLNFAGTGSGTLGVGIGGAGGDGGDSGAVTLNINDGVTVADATRMAASTTGDGSKGIVAQSLGGGGGSGGFGVTGGLSIAGTGTATMSVGIGGSGGGGGDSSTVDADITGATVTEGDDSAGVLAQSVGGGGGAGGFNVSGGLSFAGTGAGNLSVGIGGSGGDGGSAGAVTLAVNDELADPTSDLIAAQTSGDRSQGIVAQSLGGGGGNGGFNVSGGISASGDFSGNINIGIGGSGGDGGNAGDVIANITGTTLTAGDDSGAVMAQSLGGGGGNGAFNVSGGISASGEFAGNIGVGVGGSGGGGGDSGAVTLTINPNSDYVAGELFSAITGGDDSYGIVAQSIGGGGGNGGFNVDGSVALASSGAANIGVGVGGSGGDGGNAGAVTADVTGDIQTAGASSGAILAQSVGGGGGNGGFNVSAGISGSNEGSGNLLVGVGGWGGSGGDASDVDATLVGDITTAGASSYGATFQSLGGGGGNGGFDVTGGISVTLGDSVAGNVGVGIGGFGSDGGDAGDVTGSITGSIWTEGADSYGALMQSVGGGGGTGGFNVTGNVAAGSGGTGNLGFGLGGFGGGGGQAGAVDGTIIGDITTQGSGAYGATMQSLGGSGGSGGFNVTGDISLTLGDSASGNIGIGIGGFGSDGGDADAVTGAITGDILTLGSDAYGSLMQSVGGGGGSGGFNVTGAIAASSGATGNLGFGLGGFGGSGGDAGAVDGAITGDIVTAGSDAYGATFQSLGGGGGNGGFDVTGGVSLTFGDSGSGDIGIGIGGFGGGGGNASSVTGAVTGSIGTLGDGSYGALLQSAGGGGGTGGFNVTGGIAASTSTTGSIGFGLGGFGGTGGSAGLVDGTLVGDVTTYGDDAFGVALQSLGGAGGNGGFNVTGDISFTTSDSASIAASIGIGGFGGGGGDAAAVTGDITGVYITSGRNSDGVTAQSIGGGGGNGGFNVSGAIALGTGTAGTGNIGIGGFGGDGGNGASVTLTRDGDTSTSGALSDAIVAQSIGGGGGTGAFDVSGGISGTTGGSAGSFGFGLGGFGGDGGSAGDVSVAITGNVLASGLGSDIVTPEETFDIPIGGLTLTIPAYRTRADGSNGVLVQSIGGGGGAGGFNVTGEVSITTDTSTAARVASIGIGGFGGGGGDAGDVTASLQAPTGSTERVQVQAVGDDKSAFAAQSIGGGGGAGGFNISGGISTRGQLIAGVGGFGGDGGTAGDVTVDVDADIFASGNNANGLVAQSIGGGGGTGGLNVSGGIVASLNDTTEPAFVFGVGGFGGAGNSAGDVTVTQNGQVLVDGINAHGVLVQSIGGGGGAGGLNATGLISGSGGEKKLDGFSFGAGLGGYGGAGADAGDVSLTSNGNIFVNTKLVSDPESGEVTLEAEDFTGNAPGILAQSIGGGGGSGGINATGVIAPKGSPVSIGIGGTGGAGGDAGDVTVVRGYTDVGGIETETPGLINTFGAGSSGLIAQSIGGGGGNAGINAVFGLVLGSDTNDAVGAIIAVGGDGGDAGNGGDVTVRHLGDIQTDGFASDGILAQSITKGGGNGTYNIGVGLMRKASTISLAVGGSGGDGGEAGDVSVAHDGTILTHGDQSVGIRAQSIGQGGGNASTDMASSLLAANDLSIGLGGTGGSGGIGGNVSVDADGTIATEGQDSSGILAQSLGGGGGTSGSNSVGLSITRGSGADEKGYSGAVSVGIDGGAGGVAGTVDIENSADIYTDGDRSRGIFAQSIGGDGGAGGSAMGIIVQAQAAFAISVGGAGGDGAIAGDVTVGSDALIQTLGDESDGILAQSIGGGGGAGGMSGSIELQLTAGSTDSPTNTLAVAVGGTGGAGGIAGDVSASNTGTILTTGDKSYGIRAQSIGGGGGVGGAILSALVQGKSPGNSIDVNVGGGGGDGQTAGNVDVLNEGLIYTTGTDAAGISANSIGGGGGDAGVVFSASVGGLTSNTQHRLVVNIGGAGGDGGTGGDVSVINRPAVDAVEGDLSGTIVTEGSGAYGIFAQSLGGGGGNSSSIISFSGMAGSADSIVAGFNFGSVGGSGNTGGDVSVENDGLIQTSGDGAHGIFAQSLGGGGGNGGLVLAGNFLIGAPTSAPLVALGGVGGDGGDGGSVTVVNSGEIIAMGANANGILAQSIGGGGGNSSMGFALTGEPTTLILSNALSGVLGAVGGGSGGLGGDVTVIHTGDITVLGDGSQAIKAESINGGGGSLSLNFDGITALPGLSPGGSTGPAEAPDPLVAARAGADGASGMNAGNVSVTSTGTIGVGGDNASGITMDSIAGGGGTINLNFSVVAMLDGLAEGQDPLTFEGDLGGIDGTDNAGGDLNATHSGDIMTDGKGSAGISIQSIGGGGGRLFLNVTTPDPSWFGGATVVLGGTDGSNSPGGLIEDNQDGIVATFGDYSPGAVIQSIGGGGGFAIVNVNTGGDDAATVTSAATTASSSGAATTMGFRVAPAAAAPLAPTAVTPSLSGFTWLQAGADGGTGNDGGAVTASYTGGFQTSGEHAPALVVESIGAGGGTTLVSGDDSPHVFLGGFNGADGSGGAITVANDGDIFTDGIGSHGAIIQSIGGGGGVVLGSFTAPDLNLNSDNVGDGGAVSFTQTGDVALLGDQSIGILAQSIGGGGGFVDGTFAGSAGGAGSGGAVTIDVEGSMFTAGNDSSAIVAQSIGLDGAGDIGVTVIGDIEGDGDNSYGVVAQSISGTGGWAGANFFGTPGTGVGGAIDVAVGGSIAMLGDNSSGILAESIGSTSGDIDLHVAGAVFTPGADSIGIHAISEGPDGAGDIKLTANGDVRGGSGTGAGVWFEGGSDNLIVTNGSLSALSGVAVVTTTGNDTVKNTGLVVGNMFLGSGANYVLNAKRATFVTIDTLDLQDGDGSIGTFENEGDLHLGLTATEYADEMGAATTLAQTASLPLDPESDLLSGVPVISQVALDGNFIQGDSGTTFFDVAFGPYESDRIDVTGNATVGGIFDINLTWLENNDPVTLISTGGMGTDAGVSVADTIALDYNILAGADGIQLAFESDFGQDFLSPNGQALGHSLDSALEVGGASGIGRLLALLGSLTEGQEELYAEIFAELDPEAYLAPAVEQFQAARDFGSRLFSCDTDAGSEHRACLWGEASGHWLNRDSSKAAPFKFSQGTRLRVGGAIPVAEGWAIGAALGYDDLGDLRFDHDRAVGDNGEGLHGGLGIRKMLGGGKGSASLAFILGRQKINMSRRQTIFEPLTGSARVDTHYVGVMGKVGYSFGTGPVYVRPELEASAIRLTYEGFDESGLGGLGVAALRHSRWMQSVAPQLVLGAHLARTVDISFTGGAVFHNHDEIAAPFRLLGADPASDPALITTPIDDRAIIAGAEIDVAGSDRLSLHFGYHGEFGKMIDSHTAAFRLNWKF